MRIIDNIYYRLQLNTLFFNESVDIVLDHHLLEGIKSGIKSLDSDTHNGRVEFNNGTKLEYWNANKYYAWMTKGVLTLGDDWTFAYSSIRPSVKAMYLFQKELMK